MVVVEAVSEDCVKEAALLLFWLKIVGAGAFGGGGSLRRMR